MPNVYQTISAVKRDLGAVDKNGKMKGFGQDYKFRGIDDVINALHVPMYTHGLVVAPRLRSITQEDGLGKQKNQTRTVVEFEWTIAGPDGDSFIAATSGEAMDTQDKGSNKAGTAAYKQLLTQLLAIPFETDDPDNYQPNPTTTEDSKPASKPATKTEAPKAEAPAPTPQSAVRKCEACATPVGDGPIKRKAGKTYHKQCFEDQAKPAAAPADSDDISSILDTFPGAAEA